MILTPPKNFLSISVMAHESRQEFFPYLAERLGNPPFSIDKAWPENIGLWANCRRAWMMHDPEAVYHVVIQDDAIVCDNFKERAFDAIYSAIRKAETSRVALSLYYGRRGNRLREAQLALERGYIMRQALNWGVAIVLPVDEIDRMIRVCDGLATTKQDDARIGHYLHTEKIPVYYPMPSLIDHRSGKSLVGDPGENRHAYKFIDAQ